MTGPAPDPPRVKHYFVDEAGDATLFANRGRVLVGEEGCSRFFALGLVDVAEPGRLACELDELRARLLEDPYFQGVPSMRPGARKTFRAFHAKDDVPEIRREVFNLLLRHDIRFLAVIRDKTSVLTDVRRKERQVPLYRYRPNELYDSLISRLFKNSLHKEDGFDICFARRGHSDRTDALQRALQTARDRFAEQWGIRSDAPIRVTPAYPAEQPCLQAADYMLWALQRLFERGESRYLDFVWPAVRMIHDADDVRDAKYGVYYTKRMPLTLAEFQKRVPRI